MGGGIIRYTLIGLAPYSFQYDQSQTPHNQCLLLQHLIAFGNLHNFHMPVAEYRKIFRKEYLSTKIPIEPLDLNDPYLIAKDTLRFITPQSRLEAREHIEKWGNRIFPETCAENVKILDDYLTLCEVNNIRPIMFLPPMTACYLQHFNKQRLDEFYCIVRQACRKHPSAVFLDGWQLRGLTDRDFYDVDHLNIQGAAKFSAWLNHFIEQLEGKR